MQTAEYIIKTDVVVMESFSFLRVTLFYFLDFFQRNSYSVICNFKKKNTAFLVYLALYEKNTGLSFSLKTVSDGVFNYRLGQFTRNYTQTTKRGLLTTNKG